MTRSRRLTRLIGRIVESFVLAMFDMKANRRPRSAVRTQLVCDHHARRRVGGFQELLHEPLCSARVSSALIRTSKRNARRAQFGSVDRGPLGARTRISPAGSVPYRAGHQQSCRSRELRRAANAHAGRGGPIAAFAGFRGRSARNGRIAGADQWRWNRDSGQARALDRRAVALYAASRALTMPIIVADDGIVLVS